MSKKTKTNIGMFLLSMILIGYGFILGRITADDKEDEDWNIVLSFFRSNIVRTAVSEWNEENVAKFNAFLIGK